MRNFFNPFFLSFLLSCLFFFSFPNPAFAQIQSQTPEGMVYIPEGYFEMGSSSLGSEDEGPSHFVYTSGFYIDQFEVSNSDYEKFMLATGHPQPKYWEDERFNDPNSPVVGVNWSDAMAYARWLGRRLPSEAEWEKAARGTDGRSFPWGGKWDKGFFFYFVNIYGESDNYPYTAPVDYYKSGMSPFGVFNMAGNVWEWCQDWYQKEYYRYSPERNPEGPQTGRKKVLRGGSWANEIEGVRVTRRARNHPSIKNEIYGFRTVLPIQ